MKTFDSLINEVKQYAILYQDYYVDPVENNNKFINMNPDEKVDAMKNYIFMRAAIEEKFNMGQLLVLYEMLNTKNSPLDIMATALCTNGARVETDRYNELHSAYFKDVFFKSARDGYSHATQKEAEDYYNKLAVEKPALRGFQQARSSTGKKIPNREPEYLVFSKAEITAFGEEPDNKAKIDKVEAFNRFEKKFTKFKDLIEDELQFMKEDSEYRKGKKAHTNTSYDELVTAVQNFSKALESDKADEIHQRAMELKEKAGAYKNAHKGFWRGNLPKGRKRFNSASRMEDIVEKVMPKVEKSFEEADISMKNRDSTIANVKDRIKTQTSPAYDRYVAMKAVNKAYTDAVNMTIAAANINVRNSKSNYFGDSKEEFFNKQKENLTNVLAMAIAVEKLKDLAKDSIATSDDVNYVLNTPKTVFADINITSRMNIIKGNGAFKKMIDENIKSMEDVDKIANNIKKGKFNDITKEYTRQIDAAKPKKAPVMN